jgi:uncharacterized membrane-anchored protein YjiN (DUF445 family)
VVVEQDQPPGEGAGDAPRDPTPEIRTPSWANRITGGREVRLLELIDKYRRKVVHHATDLPFPPSERKPLSLERLAFETRAGLKLALKLFTPGCLVFLALSLVWDWNNVIRTLAVAGLIGFGTNWVAIKMLFWPRESRPVFGYGLIPSQRDDLVNKVATEVLENLINEELILRKVHETRIVSRFTGAMIAKLRQVAEDPEFKDDLRRMVLTYVGEMTRDPAFRARFAARAERSLEEFAGESFRGLLVRRLKEIWRGPLIELLNREIERLDVTLDEGFSGVSELVERFPRALEARQDEIDRVLTNMVVGLVHEVDLKEIIFEQLEGVTPEQLERAFLEFSDDKLSYITLLGGIFGVIGGLLILWPIGATVVIVAGVGLLWVADVLAYRWLKRRNGAAGPPPTP